MTSATGGWWRRIRRLVATGLASIGLLVLTVTFTPLTSWWSRALGGGWNAPHGEVLIVLGGAADSSDGVLAESSYLRSLYAVRVFRGGGFSTIVLSGGGTPLPVAASMQQFLVSQGVPAALLHTEVNSRSTRENALQLKPILDAMPGAKVLLTSDYHMFRAQRVFRKAGLKVLPRPIPDGYKRSGRWQTRWSVFLDLLSETGKIGYYFVRGWI